ncbi:hypothetical protein CC86DRAFT_409231 [Ophiobolus disseminans]|uniref:Fungal N-terminal domain-containing protein n=1 Tax=Ophiobolus disseminans TaxID=1469910 RepID=A0A6A6ZQG8_9PLEO|nr:hypothetical protein CC86DRAFT_409231 [Ophiobolus disseminans]
MTGLLSIIASAIAIANSAATVSRALFDVVESIKNARKEIACIVQQLSFLSSSLHVLAEFISSQQDLYRPALYKNTSLILGQYRKVDDELKKLLETPRALARLSWCVTKTKAKSLLKEIETIKTLLTLEVNIIQLAREEVRRPLSATRPAEDKWTESVLKWVREVKPSEMDFDQWDEEYSSDNTDDDDFESAEEESVIVEPAPAYRTSRPYNHQTEQGDDSSDNTPPTPRP